MGQSGIEYVDKGWSVVTGCTKISEGCENCYAEKMLIRFEDLSGLKEKRFRVKQHPKRLTEPTRWTKGYKVMVCPLGDFFHNKVTDIFRLNVFDVILNNPGHRYLFLTKRPEKMAEFVHTIEQNTEKKFRDLFPHVGLGVTVENDNNLWRLDVLDKIDHSFRWVSFEPYIEPYIINSFDTIDDAGYIPMLERLQWAVVGCETGKGARRTEKYDTDRLVGFLYSRGIPVFYKKYQQDGKPVTASHPNEIPKELIPDPNYQKNRDHEIISISNAIEKLLGRDGRNYAFIATLRKRYKPEVIVKVSGMLQDNPTLQTLDYLRKQIYIMGVIRREALSDPSHGVSLHRTVHKDRPYAKLKEIKS